jgi:hypothetical protein
MVLGSASSVIAMGDVYGSPSLSHSLNKVSIELCAVPTISFSYLLLLRPLVYSELVLPPIA